MQTNVLCTIHLSAIVNTHLNVQFYKTDIHIFIICAIVTRFLVMETRIDQWIKATLGITG